MLLTRCGKSEPHNAEKPLQGKGANNGAESQSQSAGVMDQLVLLLTANFHLNASVGACGNSRCCKQGENILLLM